MNPYASLCDDFYVNMNLSTEMDLPQGRESVLHYMERVQKQYPTMRNFYLREKGDFVLEEDKEKGNYRWTTVETRRVCSGYVNPDNVEAALAQHRAILDLAPAYLSVSPLDCEALDVLYGFDFTYRGNHNQVVAEALGVPPAFQQFMESPKAGIVNFEPSLMIALDEQCRVQCRISIETRTNGFHVRTGEFPEEQISVYFTARHYGSLPPETSFHDTVDRLAGICQEMVDAHMVEQILRPLQQAIALK